MRVCMYIGWWVSGSVGIYENSVRSAQFLDKTALKSKVYYFLKKVNQPTNEPERKNRSTIKESRLD